MNNFTTATGRTHVSLRMPESLQVIITERASSSDQTVTETLLDLIETGLAVRQREDLGAKLPDSEASLLVTEMMAIKHDLLREVQNLCLATLSASMEASAASEFALHYLSRAMKQELTPAQIREQVEKRAERRFAELAEQILGHNAVSDEAG